MAAFATSPLADVRPQSFCAPESIRMEGPSSHRRSAAGLLDPRAHAETPRSRDVHAPDNVITFIDGKAACGDRCIRSAPQCRRTRRAPRRPRRRWCAVLCGRGVTWRDAGYRSARHSSHERVLGNVAAVLGLAAMTPDAALVQSGDRSGCGRLRSRVKRHACRSFVMAWRRLCVPRVGGFRASAARRLARMRR